MSSAFLVVLREDSDWNARIGGWHCEPLRIPGACVECVWADGVQQDPVKYSQNSDDAAIRWSDKDQHPPEITARIRLTNRLVSASNVAWITAAAMVISALMGATATMLAARIKAAGEASPSAPTLVNSARPSQPPDMSVGGAAAFREELASALDVIKTNAADEVTCGKPYIDKAADRNALVLRCVGENKFYGIGKHALGKGGVVLATQMTRVAQAGFRLGKRSSLRRPIDIELATEGTADGAAGPIDPYDGPNVECKAQAAAATQVTITRGEPLTNLKLGCARAGVFDGFLSMAGFPREGRRSIASRELLNGSKSGGQRLISVVLTISHLGDMVEL